MGAVGVLRPVKVAVSLRPANRPHVATGFGEMDKRKVKVKVGTHKSESGRTLKEIVIMF